MLDNFSLFDFTAWYLIFLFSTSAHEAGHAWVALKLGDDTAHRGGQVTLDPSPHIKREPFGMVVVPLASYLMGGWMLGWASAPYDQQWALRNPKRAGLMALSGPAANLSLLVVAAILLRLGVLLGWFTPAMHPGFMHVASARQEGLCYLASVLLSLFFSLNLLLAAFNLLPIPPLDGSNTPLIFLSESVAQKYWNFMRNPGVSYFGLFAAWKLGGQLFAPLQLFALKLLFPEAHYG